MANVKGFSSVPQIVANVTLDPSSIPAGALSTETFTVNGLDVTMQVMVQAPSLEAGLVLLPARVTAANTLELNILNKTAAAVDPAAQVFNVYGL